MIGQKTPIVIRYDINQMRSDKSEIADNTEVAEVDWLYLPVWRAQVSVNLLLNAMEKGSLKDKLEMLCGRKLGDIIQESAHESVD